MIFELAKDLADALATMPAEHPKRRMLELLQEAVRRDIHFVARHPTTFFQCMWNTCWWYDCPEAAAHYVEPEGGWTAQNAPWLRPDEAKLCLLLERWREAREQSRRSVPWLRSRRPPSIHLGTAQKAVFRGHEGWVCSVSYSPDGQRIVSGSHDKTVRVWDAATGAEVAVLRGHDHWIHSVSYSPDGQRIVSGSDDNTVCVWDAASGAELAVLRGHEDWVTRVSYTPDGRRIASGSYDNTVRVWDAQTHRCVEVIQGSGDVAAIAAGASSGLAWRAITRDGQTVIEPSGGGDPIAHFPIELSTIITHPSGRSWAGGKANHLYIITLEGEPGSAEENSGDDERSKQVNHAQQPS